MAVRVGRRAGWSARLPMGRSGGGWPGGLVGAGGAGEGEFAVGVTGGGPAALVEEAVVVAAQQDAVGLVGAASVDPVD